MSDLPTLGYGDKEGFKKLAEQPSELFVIYNERTGALIRVVECQPYMVTMSGEWSSDYTAKKWNNIFKAITDDYA